MKIVRISVLTGKETTREIDVTDAMILAWMQGGLIQDVMPNLSADDREFIMTGITPEEWEAAFGEPEESEADDDVEFQL
jgi:hypothetical protein